MRVKENTKEIWRNGRLGDRSKSSKIKDKLKRIVEKLWKRNNQAFLRTKLSP